ncbi:MAG: type I restriction enzyme S subunit [Arenicella sp.]|jgi:type I restriction enzyme S subunit
MSNKHAVKEASASYQSTPVPLVNRELQSFITGNPLTDNLNLWISATKAKSTSGRGSNKKIELVGIKKLRELILELAVRGKLVPQNPEDEPASKLLKKIDAEKAKLIAEGKIKKQKKLPEVSEDEKPFELPKGWEWTRLGNIALINPRNDATDELEVSFIPMTLISTSHKGDHSQETKHWIDVKKAFTHFANGDVAIAKITPCFENSKAAVFSNLVNGIGAGTTELHVARPHTNLSPQFLLLIFKSPVYISQGERQMTGSAGQKRVPKNYFESHPLPLPPLAEQHRIVDKVDELMVLCDQLEQHSEHQLDAHKQLVETLLATLVESENADDLATNWQRLAEHFDTLFSGALTSTAGIGNGGGEWAIDRLKDTILQLAVMGKLVPQNPDDEPASELLKKIDAEKSKLVKEGKIKKPKKLPPVSDDEKLFELPEGWEWAIFSRISLSITNGLYKPAKDYIDEGIPSLRMYNIQQREISFHDIKRVSVSEDEYQKYHLSSGDILINRVNSKELVGKSAHISFLVEPTVFEAMNMRVQLLNDLIDSRYIVLYLDSSFGKSYFYSLAKEAVGQASINQAQINNLYTPIPPLAEQQRVIAKVDELFVVCDQLKTRLQAASETQLTLTEALVEQALQ